MATSLSVAGPWSPDKSAVGNMPGGGWYDDDMVSEAITRQHRHFPDTLAVTALSAWVCHSPVAALRVSSILVQYVVQILACQS